MHTQSTDWREHSPLLHEQFDDYLRGKTVAIVGVSDLHDMEQEALIDSHDVVVRVHRLTPRKDPRLVIRGNDSNPPPLIPEIWQPYIGSRTDIFFQNISKGANPERTERIVNAFFDEGGQFICTATWNEIWYAGPKIWDLATIRYLNPEDFYDLWLQLGTRPLAGTVVIADILKRDIKSAYITGFPCFVSELTPKGLTKGHFQTVNDLLFLRDHYRRIHNPNKLNFDKHMLAKFDWV